MSHPNGGGELAKFLLNSENNNISTFSTIPKISSETCMPLINLNISLARTFTYVTKYGILAPLCSLLRANTPNTSTALIVRNWMQYEAHKGLSARLTHW
jgi:hypothetical protein